VSVHQPFVLNVDAGGVAMTRVIVQNYLQGNLNGYRVKPFPGKIEKKWINSFGLKSLVIVKSSYTRFFI
jgi:hypothetical protein